MPEADPFTRYVVERLRSTPFTPDGDAPEEMTFAASLASFRKLHERDWGGTNARGEALFVEAGYLESMTPNAFADVHFDRHFIGMHQALLVTIMDLALFAFTQSALFPTVGDAESEASPSPARGGVPGLYLLELTLRGESVEAELAKHRVPQDADRHVMAVYLAMLMARFVWEHELAHCQLGHVLFLQTEGQGAHLSEAPFGPELVGRQPSRLSSVELSAIRHTFELEADAAALRNCIAIQLENIENIPGIRALDPGLRIQMSVFGAYLMTWLFEAYGRHAAIEGDASHPEPMMRLASLQRTTRTLLGALDGFDAFHQGIVDQFETLIDALGIETRVRPSLNTTASTVTATVDLLAAFRFVQPS